MKSALLCIGEHCTLILNKKSYKSKLLVLKSFTIVKFVSLHKPNYCKYKNELSKYCDKMHNFISMYRETLHTHFDWKGRDSWAWILKINTGIDFWYRYLPGTYSVLTRVCRKSTHRPGYVVKLRPDLGMS